MALTAEERSELELALMLREGREDPPAPPPNVKEAPPPCGECGDLFCFRCWRREEGGGQLEGWYLSEGTYRYFLEHREYAAVFQPRILLASLGGGAKNIQCYNVWKAEVRGAEYDSVHVGAEAAMLWAERLVERRLKGESY